MLAPKKRNGKIDFLRFLFAVIVLIYHSRYVVGDEKSLFLGGSFAVEFFFLVSGYLMIASIRRMPPPTKSLSTETGIFLLKKYQSFFPELLIAYVIAAAVTTLALNGNFIKLLVLSYSDVLLVGMTGLQIYSINVAIWYLSSMLLAMAILYPLLRKYGDTALYIIIPLLTLFLLGWFCGNEESPRKATKWIGWTYRGNLRALAEMGAGICLYPIVEKVKKINFTVFARILLTALEYGCYAQLLYHMNVRSFTRYDYFYLLVFAVALTISFSQKGIDTALFRGRFFAWLGKFSFPLYLSHYFYSQTVRTFFPGLSDRQLLITYYGLSALTALVVMGLSGLIRKIFAKLALHWPRFLRPVVK